MQLLESEFCVMDPPPNVATHIGMIRKLWFALIQVKRRMTFCLLPRTEPEVDLSRWMEALPAEVRNRRLSSLMIPGAHDAGSYGLKTSFGFAPDQSDLERAWWFRYFPRVTLSIARRWTKTQSADITQQLLHGVRYFDLRGAPKIYQEASDHKFSSTKLFFVHALYGPSLTKIASRVNEFLDTHDQELVILHFQHFHAVNEVIEKRFLEELLQVFGSKLCPFNPETANSSVEELMKKGHQVILFFPSNSKITSDKVWPSAFLPNPWADTTDIKALQQFLDAQIASRCQDRLFVTQGVLTPDHSYIRSHFLSSLRKSLAEPCNKFISSWAIGFKATSSGPNIIMTDYVDWNDYELPRKIVLKNFDPLAS